ncbi:alpha/beta hydrolase [Deinococcus cellulosilyticus]|uniref:Serine aminopeptidase S33 domain-containing protein n=1 Tax=Deinococcus cellulosilyticus (strain DSM 18568 / NBRC 106333 / KACC 11606 / 5516J-15) TaxID=1223518 RepID=A0A511MWU4_DEIC1|nr:alpha/beta fold hydrolase [Deinococcus cellulosilyticus]GEM45039.1 hypothetical protein DC3_06740 [Deinococcus cellulosilyticus NBRC 106333 = KACC 11606]
MKKLLFSLVALALTPAFAQQTVQMEAQDGVKVVADYYATDNPAGAIILFNGAHLDPNVPARNRCEYGDFPKTLQQKGYAVLNVDLRISGHWSLCQNRTHGPVADAYDAMQDVEAAVKWMQQTTGQQKVILFGSGFSSMMHLFYALKHPDQVKGVAAFGLVSNSITLTDEVAGLLPTLKIPLIMVSPEDEKGLSEAILTGVPAQMARLVVAPPLNGYTLGFNDPRTLEVYQKSSLDFLSLLSR